MSPYKIATKIRAESYILNTLAYNSFDSLSGDDRKLFLEVIKSLQSLANQIEDQEDSNDK